MGKAAVYVGVKKKNQDLYIPCKQWPTKQVNSSKVVLGIIRV